jgi:hypothetical protein
MHEPTVVGEVSFLPQEGRLRIEIEDGKPWTFWTVGGARYAIAVLQAWVNAQETD